MYGQYIRNVSSITLLLSQHSISGSHWVVVPSGTQKHTLFWASSAAFSHNLLKHLESGQRHFRMLPLVIVKWASITTVVTQRLYKVRHSLQREKKGIMRKALLVARSTSILPHIAGELPSQLHGFNLYLVFSHFVLHVLPISPILSQFISHLIPSPHVSLFKGSPLYVDYITQFIPHTHTHC